MDEDTLKKGQTEEEQDAALRARNRTIMLNPDVTGQVRARLQHAAGAPVSGNESGFITPSRTPIGGASQSSAIAPEAPMQNAPQAPRQNRAASTQPLIGFLVSFDDGPTGEYYELRAGRLIVTSEDNGAANNLLIFHPTVSPMHAIIRVAASGNVQVLDQLSEHGTQVKRAATGEVDELSGDKTALEHGDQLFFGERSFYICIIPRVGE